MSWIDNKYVYGNNKVYIIMLQEKNYKTKYAVLF